MGLDKKKLSMPISVIYFRKNEKQKGIRVDATTKSWVDVVQTGSVTKSAARNHIHLMKDQNELELQLMDQKVGPCSLLSPDWSS